MISTAVSKIDAPAPMGKGRRVIPLSRLVDDVTLCVGTVGTPFCYSHAHAEKTYIPEKHIFSREGEDREKGVPTVPNGGSPCVEEGLKRGAGPSQQIADRSMPAFLFQPPVRSLHLGDTNCEQVRDGSLIVALDLHGGRVKPRVLHAADKEQGFWDCEKNTTVPPPRFYLLLSGDPGFDPVTERRLAETGSSALGKEAKAELSSVSKPSCRPRSHQLITKQSDLAEVVAALQDEVAIGLDVETYGAGKADALDPWRGEIRLLQLAGEDTHVFLLDLKAIGYELGPLADLLASKLIVGHNLRFDACWLRVKCGLRLSRLFCTLTAARLLAAGTRAGNNLNQCLERFCGIAPAPDQSCSDWGNPLLTQDQIAYAARDVAHLHLLKGCLDRELEMPGLDGVFAMERRLLPVVIDMEVAGMPVDADKMHHLEVTWRDQAAAIASEVRSDLGRPDLNIGSAKQLLAALKDRGIEASSTNEETLQSCGDRGIVPKILAYRGLEKRAQQAASLIEAMAGDGRIHGQFDPMGTATGRFSSKSPNLQNIGRGELRSCFAAGPGRVMVIADYSQIELRAAAAIAGEKKMIEAYARGDDLHKLTASAVLGKPLQDVTKEDRQLAKAVNFGLLYGQSPKGLARYAQTAYGVTITEEEARMMRRKFFDTYGSLRQWHGLSRVSAEKGVQEIRTISGRRRLIPPSATEWERFTALVNTPVQGGCADGLKQALIDLSAALPDGAKIISTVHDEIIVECSEAQAEAVRDLLPATMRNAMAALFPQVPIEVEANICRHWGDKP